MKKLFLILCLSTATINAMELDTQKANPVQAIEQLVSALRSVNTDLDFLVKSEDMSNAQITAKLSETGNKGQELSENFTKFKSSFNAKQAAADGTITLDDMDTMLNAITHGQSIMLSISIKQIALVQKVGQQEREENKKQLLTFNENPQTTGKALIGIGCCLIMKGIYDALQK